MPEAMKIYCVIAFMILLLGDIHAQSRSVGATFSYAGTGLAYEHVINGETFIEAQVRLETLQYLSPVPGRAGISGSFTWNMIFAEHISRNGNTINCFAGPGVLTGISDDFLAPRGIVFGLKGRVGVECLFSRNVIISASVSPVVGAHIGVKDEMPHMRLYRNGLLFTLMPEIGIKYAF